MARPPELGAWARAWRRRAPPVPLAFFLAAACAVGATAGAAGPLAPRRELAGRRGATTTTPPPAKAGARTTTTPWYTTKTTLIANGTLSLDKAAELKRSSEQHLALEPWRHPHPGVRPGECPRRFVPPPKAPHHATELNGISLPDACFNSSHGPHHVFVIGDWGGVLGDRGDRPVPADRRSRHMPSHHRPFVLGADDRAQQNVADQMEKRSAVHPPDYVLNLGDNFYWGGVLVKCGGPAFNVKDASGQWEWVFERIYDFKGLEGRQWLGVLGNHDYGGFMFTHGWDQAIGYTWTKGHPSKGRWVTPAQYWSVKVHYHDFSVDYYFVDSNPWDAFEPHADPGHNLCSRKHNLRSGATCGVQGPVSIEECPAWFDRLWEAEVEWLNKGLEASVADWQIIVTHFPPEHGLMDWKRITSKHGVDLLIAGHRHQQEVHHLEEGNFLRPTAYLVSGGGGGITSEGLPDAEGHDDQYGFMDLTLAKNEIRVEAISHGGQLRSTTCIRPVSRSGELAPEVAHSLCEGRERRPQRTTPAPSTSSGAADDEGSGHNCREGLEDWQLQWSYAKGMWCCQHRGVCIGAFSKDGARHGRKSTTGRPPRRRSSTPEPRGGRTPPNRDGATTTLQFTTEQHRQQGTTLVGANSGGAYTSRPSPAPTPLPLPPPPEDVPGTYAPPTALPAVFTPAVLAPMGAPAVTPAPASAAVGGAFDCLEGYYTLDKDWSQEKRFWCCAHEKLGCNHLHNCDPNSLGNAITTWSYDKMQFCCETFGVSCLSTQAPAAEVAPAALYNCNPARPGNSLDRWANAQVAYCCNNFQIGCNAPGSPATSLTPVPLAFVTPAPPAPTYAPVEEAPRFDCQADLLDWELMWSVVKQRWCCGHEKLGCSHFEDCYYSDDDNLYGTWSLSKKEWCCMHWGVRCADISSPSVPFKQLWLRGLLPSSAAWRPWLPGPLRRFPLLSAVAGVAALAAAAVVTRKAIRRLGEPVRGVRISFGSDEDWEDELLTME